MGQKAIAPILPAETKRKGQSVLEYAVIIGTIVLALLVMQGYLKRSLQGKLKVIADDLGQQYNPQNTTSSMNITYESDTTTETFTRTVNDTDTGDEYEEVITNTTINNETQTRQGTETVGL